MASIKRTIRTPLLLLVLAASLVSAAAAQETLTILVHSVHLQALGGAEGLVAEFQEETGITLEFVTGGTNEIREKALIEWVANTGRYDVIVWLPRWLTGEMASFLEPLDEYLASADAAYDADDLIPSLLDAGRFPKPDGPVYMVPFRVGVAMLYMNRGLMEEHGVTPPTNWDEFYRAAQALTLDTDGNGSTDVYGWAQRGVSPEVAEDFYRVGYAFGGEILSQDSSACLLNTEPWVQALTLMKNSHDEGLMPPDLLAWGRDDYILGMQQGRVAMSMMYSPYWDLLTDPNESTIADQVGWSVAPTAPGVPDGRTQLSVWSWTINKLSQNKDNAWRFIEFATNKENTLREALEWGNGPVRTSTYEDEEYLAKFPLARDWLAAIDASADLPAHDNLPQIEDILIVELHHALQGRKSPQQALDDTCRSVEPLL